MAARPKTLPAAAAPVFVGTAMACAGGGFHALSATCALLAALLIQVGTNLANDYFDHAKGTDTPDRLGPTRVSQAGLVAPRKVLAATVLVFALACVPGLYIVIRGGWPFVVVGLVSISCGVLYTAGPYPLGYLGLGDLFVLIFFGPVAVAGTYYVQAQSLPGPVLLAGLGPGLLSVAILTVNNLRDVDQDRIAGKRTLPVRFGRGFAKAEYLACFLAACIGIPVGVAAWNRHWWTVIAALTLLAAVPNIRVVLMREDGPSLNNALATTGKLLLLYSVLLSVGWMI